MLRLTTILGYQSILYSIVVATHNTFQCLKIAGITEDKQFINFDTNTPNEITGFPKFE